MDKKHDGLWALIISEGKRFLARIDAYEAQGVEAGKPITYFCDDRVTKEDVICSPRLRLSPVLDFISMDQPIARPGKNGEPEISFSKTPIVLPYDYVTGTAVLYTKWSSIMFIDDLSEADQKIYHGMITDGLSTPDKSDKPLISLVPPGTRLGNPDRRGR
jgi:hypothetical protein